MRALWRDPAGGLTLQDAVLPAAEAECLIRVTRAGICGTDLQMLAGYADFVGVLGHEFVGIVERAPAAASAWVGKRVVGAINVGCGACDVCARGVPEHCPSRTVLGIRGRWGAFAEHLTLPAANLFEVPERVPDDAAVFAEPVAAACRIFEHVEIADQTRVAVLGDGRLGNLTAQVLATRTPTVVMFGRHEHKLAVAQALGLAVRRSEALEGEPFDVVVEATGRPEGLAQAMTLVKPRGTIVLKSTYHGDAPVALWPIPVHEITVVGSRCGPFPPALALLASGRVRTAPLVAGVVPMSEYVHAFKRARRELKILLDPAG